MVVEYLRANDNFGMRVEISREEELLDTGGGLKKAAGFFLRDAGEEPFVLHNVDVLSSIDLAEMARFHGANKALATLAVMNRESSRQLLFDGEGRLCGRRSAGEAAETVGGQGVGYGPTDGPPVADAGVTDGPPAAGAELAFCGVHVISPRIFARMDEGAAFPIIPTYLRLAGEGEKIAAFRADAYYWRDLGTVASLRMAAEDVARGAVEA
jgi:NDP-sugar pyrophosphorylase family protein